MSGVKRVRDTSHRDALAELPGESTSCAQHRRFVETLFEHIGEALRRYVSALLRHRADTEDVLQETYLRLLKGNTLEQSLPRARAYAFRIATNLAHDRFRRREEPGLDEVDAGLQTAAGDTPESMCDLACALERIEQVLLDLKPRCRRVFLLRTAEELSYEEIAAALGVSKRTVEREMKHALDVMQRTLEGEP